MQQVNRKQTWRGRNCSGVERVMVARSVSVLLLLFCVWVCLLPPSLLCVSVTLSTDSCLSFPVSAVFILQEKKMEQRCVSCLCFVVPPVLSLLSLGQQSRLLYSLYMALLGNKYYINSRV